MDTSDTKKKKEPFRFFFFKVRKFHHKLVNGVKAFFTLGFSTIEKMQNYCGEIKKISKKKSSVPVFFFFREGGEEKRLQINF